MSQSSSNHNKETFSQKMVDILNYGALNLAMGIGYRLNLFEVMDIFDSPQPIESISISSGLNARYIEEWLGIMVTGRIIELTHDNGEVKYFLPKEHGDFLTKRSGSNMGVYTQEIPLLTTCALEHVIKGFNTGDGVSYEHYPKFQAFMTELSNAKHCQVLVDKFLPSVDNGRLVERLKQGIRVCDLGCGEGVAVILMAEAFPKSSFIGIDIDKQVIEIGQKSAKAKNLKNIGFLAKDSAMLEQDNGLKNFFHYITAFDSIHDQTNPLAALRSIRHMLNSEGIFSMIDIASETGHAGNMDHSMGPFLYTVSLMHCMPVGLNDKGAGLGMMWGKDKACKMLNQAGFSKVEVNQIPEDSFNLHYFCHK